MATRTQGKWSWRAVLRHFIPRATPYWRTRLEDDQEESEWPVWAELLVWQVLQVGVLAVTISAMAQLTLAVFLVPGGLPAVIGQQLGDVCRITGNCDFGYLLASYAVAVDILIGVGILLISSILRATTWKGRDRREEDMAWLDARFVELRDELMAAGILTKPPEELPEVE